MFHWKRRNVLLFRRQCFYDASEMLKCPTFVARIRCRNVLETFVSHILYKKIKIVKYSISKPPIDGVIHFIKEKICPGYKGRLL